MRTRVKGEAIAFQYGFLASRTAGALNEYLSEGTVSRSSRKILGNASSLVDDILTAQGFFGREPGKNFTPSEKGIDAYTCVLHMIIDHKNEFSVHTLQDLRTLFGTILMTLKNLASDVEEERPSRKEVQDTRRFFTRLTELMLDRLSTPPEVNKSELLPVF